VDPSVDVTELRLLILEDNDSDTRLLLRTLHRSGFRPVLSIAASQEQYLEALAEQPDLILADYTLNGFDALQALKILRERDLDIPFIVVTGTVGEEVVAQCMRLGAADYLLKDRLGRLGEAIRSALRAHELRRENQRSQRELLEAREKAHRDYLALLGRLGELAQQVGLARGAHGIYRALFDFCTSSTRANSIFVASFDADSELRTLAYCAELVDGAYEEGEVAALPRMPLNESPQGRAIREGRPVIVRDYPSEVLALGLNVVDIGSDADEKPPLSALAVPLMIQGRTIGAFEVQSIERDAFSEADVPPLMAAASHAAIALQNVRLLEREREQREAAEISEQRYRDLVEQASDGIVVIDEAGRVLQANTVAERMMGVEAGELLGTEVRDWSYPPREGPTLQLSSMAVGESALIERVLRSRVGPELPVEINVRRLASGNFQSIMRDISERKRAEKELLNEKLFSDTVINSLPGIFYLFDDNFKLRRWNRNTSVVTGYSEEEIESMSPLEFFSQEQHDYLTQQTKAVLNEGSATASAKLLTREGKQIPYIFSSVRLVMDGRPLVLGTGLDVSQRQQAEERVRELNLELEKRLTRLSALHEIDMAITGSVDLRLTLGVVLDKVRSELRVDACSVWSYEKASRSLTRVVSQGLEALGRRRLEVHLGSGPVGRCGLERKLVRLRGPELAREQVVGNGDKFGDYLAVPLVSKGQLQGVLEIFSSNALDTNEDWLEFLEALALQTAIAIDNVLLFQGLERAAVDVTLAYDATIEGWARALDLRDHETEGHSRRVTELSVSLARHMGVDEADMAHIRRGALLHDIGKLGVPDAILVKPGELTDEERKVMQRHPRLGYELLSPIGFLRPAIDIPYCHHEGWDGSGYPRGLRGEEIPLSARIFAAADVFDALTSDRPYRSAWAPARALQYLAERAGTQFDPRVVKAFLELHGGG
jgi:PAS domain S-box-containing protein/putative nucleotidyltransferase with HDIG domain